MEKKILSIKKDLLALIERSKKAKKKLKKMVKKAEEIKKLN